MIKVSIIIPVYNIGEYISKCLDSVLAQTLHEIEIICVDDASSDNSKSIILAYIKKDSRIKLIEHETNQGAGIARKVGDALAEGEYIAHIDPDDYISEDYFDNLYYTAKIYDADMCFTTNIYTVKENIIKPYYHNRTEKWQKEIKNNWYEGISYFDVDTPEKENTREYPLVSSVNKIWRKEFLDKNNLEFSSYRLAEDVDFFYRALSLSPKISFNHNSKYFYVQRSNSLVHNVKKEDKIPTDILDVFRNVFNAYKENSNDKLMHSNYWNFRSFLSTFDPYKGAHKEEFYKMTHDLFNSLDVCLDTQKYPFVSSQIETIKKYEHYKDYINHIEKPKKIVYSIAWLIPKIEWRENFKTKVLNAIYKKKSK